MVVLFILGVVLATVMAALLPVGLELSGIARPDGLEGIHVDLWRGLRDALSPAATDPLSLSLRGGVLGWANPALFAFLPLVVLFIVPLMGGHVLARGQGLTVGERFGPMVLLTVMGGVLGASLAAGLIYGVPLATASIPALAPWAELALLGVVAVLWLLFFGLLRALHRSLRPASAEPPNGPSFGLQILWLLAALACLLAALSAPIPVAAWLRVLAAFGALVVIAGLFLVGGTANSKGLKILAALLALVSFGGVAAAAGYAVWTEAPWAEGAPASEAEAAPDGGGEPDATPTAPQAGQATAAPSASGPTVTETTGTENSGTDPAKPDESSPPLVLAGALSLPVELPPYGMEGATTMPLPVTLVIPFAEAAALDLSSRRQVRWPLADGAASLVVATESELGLAEGAQSVRLEGTFMDPDGAQAAVPWSAIAQSLPPTDDPSTPLEDRLVALLLSGQKVAQTPAGLAVRCLEDGACRTALRRGDVVWDVQVRTDAATDPFDQGRLVLAILPVVEEASALVVFEVAAQAAPTPAGDALSGDQPPLSPSPEPTAVPAALPTGAAPPGPQQQATPPLPSASPQP